MLMFCELLAKFCDFVCRRASCSSTVEIDIHGAPAVLLRVSPLLFAFCCDSQDDLASCTGGNHFANELQEQHAVSESLFPFNKADPWSSFISLSQ